ncbi:MAG: DUF2905 domain-containing protein [Proteobacteria bacterium]|nr:DUF2905 domain-containing protein [Pseudomonadota bacterium]
MEGLGKALIILGVIIILAGIVILLAPRVPFVGEYLGKLPGDIHIKKEGFSFYFPITSCIIISLVISLILYLLRR